MQKGTLIEFWLHGRRHLAVVDRPKDNKHWIVVDHLNQAHTINPRQVTYTVGSAYTAAEITAFQAAVAAQLDPDSLEVAWEILVEEGRAVDPVAMSTLLFADTDPVNCYAAHCLLSEDKLYFKQRGDVYEPRTASQVADLKHQASVAQQRQQEWETLLARLQQAIAQPGQVEWQPSDRPRLEALERYATLKEEANPRDITQAQEVLAALQRPETPDAAFDLLVALGLWQPHENLFLRRSQIPLQFPPTVLAMATSRLASPPADADRDRVDLTYLKVYTIDDASTLEIDDGLSWEVLPDGREQLWVHIADPTRWLAPGDELDLEARRRSTTLYLPTGMIPMFPPEIATGPMSLNQGQECCALSFGVILAPDGSVADYRIVPSLVKPTYRLTYEDVDEMLELGVQAEPEIAAIARWVALRSQWRQSQGAISIHMPEASIKVEDDEVTIQLLEDSLARQLVAEMMILAGEVAARYGQAHNLPLPFRNQPQPDLPSETELLQLPPGPVRYSAIRRCMPRSEVSLTPARHASLGLDTYTQVTSPIRRYSDLLAHFQIKAHLRGEPLPFSAEQLQEVLMSVSAAAQEAVWVERQTNRYWGLEFLRRHATDLWQGLVLRWLREHESLALVLLEDLGLELAMRFDRPVALGEQLTLRVAYVDPRNDVIHLREVDPATIAELPKVEQLA